MPQANRMNRDQSDVMNNETTAENNEIAVNSSTSTDNGTHIPVPHGLDDLEVQVDRVTQASPTSKTDDIT